MTETKRSGVTYQRADDSYFEERGLRRFAGVWSLWALGVGAVISGDFFGWNFGLLSGGFGGLLTATLIVAVMYIGLCFSIAELSPALPHTGGAYSFGRMAFGRLPDRPRGKHRIRPHPRRDRRGDRRLCRHDPRNELRLERTCPPAVGALLCGIRRNQYHRR